MSTQNQNRRPQIDGGPGKFDLMVAVFDNTTTAPRHVVFGIADSIEIRSNGNHEGYLHSQPCNVMINGMEREDGSGNRWLFKGYIVEGGCFRTGGRVNGYYDIKTRKGWIEFEK